MVVRGGGARGVGARGGGGGVVLLLFPTPNSRHDLSCVYSVIARYSGSNV